MSDVLIIGGGPAGLTAALYAARAGLFVLVMEQALRGGQMTTTFEVSNYPGVKTLSGAELALGMEEQARAVGVSFRDGEVNGFDFTPGRLRALTGAGEALPAESIILAMGARRRTLGIPGEALFTGRGVSYCATCDGHFFKDRDVLVVGGGNTALEDALYLAGVCRHVTLIHRRDAYRAQKHLTRKLELKSNLTQRLRCELLEIAGERAVTGALLRDNGTGRTETLAASAVFVAVGVLPYSETLRGLLPLAEDGRVEAPEDGTTGIPGVFVAGDLRKKPLYQIVTACADGAAAAQAAQLFLEER